jgi:tripartite-type tricarboxylate transporter receptor subunit TctC
MHDAVIRTTSPMRVRCSGGVMKRRDFVGCALGAVALPAFLRGAYAQSYPTHSVRIVVGVAAGGGMDFAGRIIAQALTERLGQQFFVDNRPGAGTNVGTEWVVNSPPDGYTLLLVSGANAINATLYKHLSFNFIRDTTPIATIARVPQVMEVHPSVPANSVPEFIAYAKANPHKINLATAGNGSVQQVAGELFRMMTEIDIVDVPYNGAGPALVDLLAGQTQLMFDTTPGSLPHIKAGRLRALAVTTASRVEILPDLPTVGEFVPGYEASQWYGLVGPKNIPGDVIERLNKEVNAAIVEPAMKARLADLGGAPLQGTSADFRALVVSETEKWGRVVKFSGATAD